MPDADKADLLIEGEISKVDDEQRQVFGWASITELNGAPVVDRQNDLIETVELEKAAYDYVLHSRMGGEMHQRVGKVADAPKQVSTLIESMVLTPEKIAKMGLPPETPRGWWIGFQVQDDTVWKGVKDKKYTSFSIHGKGLRKVMPEPVGKSSPLDEVEGMDPRVKFLFSKAAEMATTTDEFIGCIEDISKALADHDEELSAYVGSVHKHLTAPVAPEPKTPVRKQREPLFSDREREVLTKYLGKDAL